MSSDEIAGTPNACLGLAVSLTHKIAYSSYEHEKILGISHNALFPMILCTGGDVSIISDKIYLKMQNSV